MVEVGPSAGHEWIATKLLYVAPDYSLHDVGVDRSSECGKLLPPLNEEESQYGAHYRFEGPEIRFTRIRIVAGERDQPDSQKVAVYTGEAVIRYAPSRDKHTEVPHPSFVLTAVSCEKHAE
jgi:hypothetical protein